MTDQSELNSRAALCEKLARREPTNRIFWMAEAENWSRLSKEAPDGEGIIDTGVLARLRVQSTRPCSSWRSKRRVKTGNGAPPSIASAGRLLSTSNRVEHTDVDPDVRLLLLG